MRVFGRMRAARPARLKQKVENDVFKRYQKLRYMTRVKHWHGRDVHSPFAYGLVREALMDRRETPLRTDRGLYEWLRGQGISSRKCMKICRVYAFLGYGSYCTDYVRYAGEDMVLIPGYISEEQLERLSEEIEACGKRICVVLFGIYRTLPQHHVWHYLLRNVRCVAMDFYSFALLFFDRELNPQYYKMKL